MKVAPDGTETPLTGSAAFTPIHKDEKLKITFAITGIHNEVHFQVNGAYSGAGVGGQSTVVYSSELGTDTRSYNPNVNDPYYANHGVTQAAFTGGSVTMTVTPQLADSESWTLGQAFCDAYQTDYALTIDGPVTEGGVTTARVHRSGDLGLSTTPFAVEAIGGTAIFGDDYTVVPLTGQFAPGETEKVLTISAIDDDKAELAEDLTLGIVPDSNYGIVSGAGQATTTIDQSDIPILQSITGTNTKYTDQFASTGVLEFDPDYSETTIIGSLTLTADVAPGTADAYSHVFYRLKGPAGDTVQEGSISRSGTALTLDFTGFPSDAQYTIEAGVDQNLDGTFDPGEVTQTLQAKRKPVFFDYGSPKRDQPGESMTNRLQVPAGTTKTYESIKVTDSKGVPVTPPLDKQVKLSGGGVVTGITVNIVYQAGGSYKLDITVPATGVGPGDYDIRVFVKGDPNGNGITVRIKV
jgi:hypothetical protein